MVPMRGFLPRCRCHKGLLFVGVGAYMGIFWGFCGVFLPRCHKGLLFVGWAPTWGIFLGFCRGFLPRCHKGLLFVGIV